MFYTENKVLLRENVKRHSNTSFAISYYSRVKIVIKFERGKLEISIYLRLLMRESNIRNRGCAVSYCQMCIFSKQFENHYYKMAHVDLLDKAMTHLDLSTSLVNPVIMSLGQTGELIFIILGQCVNLAFGNWDEM